MLRRIVYPYLPPTCNLSIQPPYSSGYVEVGSAPSVKLDYQITKRSLPTTTTIFSYMIPSSYPAITNSGQTVISGSVSGVIITPVTSATTSFTITVLYWPAPAPTKKLLLPVPPVPLKLLVMLLVP